MELAAFSAKSVSASLTVKKGTREVKKIVAGLGATLMLLCVGRAALAFPVKPLIPAERLNQPF